MIYYKLAQLTKNLIKQFNQWKDCEPGNRKPPYVKLYSSYAEYSIACKTLNLTHRNRFINTLESGFSDIIECIKNLNTFESIEADLFKAVDMSEDDKREAGKILRKKFTDAETFIMVTIANMTQSLSVGKFLMGAIRCYSAFEKEAAREFAFEDLEKYRMGCMALDVAAEQILEDDEVLEVHGPVLKLSEVIDNICNLSIDTLESINQFRIYKSQPLTRATHYSNAIDNIKGMEDDIETLLQHFITKTTKEKQQWRKHG